MHANTLLHNIHNAQQRAATDNSARRYTLRTNAQRRNNATLRNDANTIIDISSAQCTTMRN
eukprot:11185103-Lingulodinium_polyedra.AAC.1